jgi:formamidopyrimidine-DNA glycosylase
LDQTLIAGLGNIYDDETLYAAKVNPKRPAGASTQERRSRFAPQRSPPDPRKSHP